MPRIRSVFLAVCSRWQSSFVRYFLSAFHSARHPMHRPYSSHAGSITCLHPRQTDGFEPSAESGRCGLACSGPSKPIQRKIGPTLDFVNPQP